MEPGPFAEAFSSALRARSITLGGLHRSLQARGVAVSLATLSYWRSGQREPEHEGSLRALAEIELLLGLDPGALERLLERRRRQVRREVLTDLSADHDVIGSLLDRLGFQSPSDELIDREVTLKYELGPDGSPVRCSYVVAVESIHSDADRRASVLTIKPGVDPPTIAALGGGRMGEVLHDRERGIVVGEMLLDRPLVEGESALLEQEVVYRSADPDDTSYFYWAVRRMRSVSLWIRFHPERVPARCEYYTIVNGVEESFETELFGTSVSRTVSGFGPGTLGIRWHWD